ncbi:unnamed protein product [Lactuca saligna]|uniref:Uncharacterized protein n=1 Tax=Lactuca saligna TaxID=75948 RepID=A0AA36EC53_LACSI|nr:unnamed protein product [Lactuca saligna]
MSKKISNLEALSWRVADDSGLTARLAPFLTRVLRDDNGLELFIYHCWQRVIGCWEGAYVSRTTEESVVCSPIYRLIHCLVSSIIFQRQECDKVPSGNLFYMWCLIKTEDLHWALGF